jgi:hypothetical protein
MFHRGLHGDAQVARTEIMGKRMEIVKPRR